MKFVTMPPKGLYRLPLTQLQETHGGLEEQALLRRQLGHRA